MSVDDRREPGGSSRVCVCCFLQWHPFSCCNDLQNRVNVLRLVHQNSWPQVYFGDNWEKSYLQNKLSRPPLIAVTITLTLTLSYCNPDHNFNVMEIKNYSHYLTTFMLFISSYKTLLSLSFYFGSSHKYRKKEIQNVDIWFSCFLFMLFLWRWSTNMCRKTVMTCIDSAFTNKDNKSNEK